MIGAIQEAVRKASRKRELHFLHVARRERDRPAGPGLVNGGSVMTRDVGDVLGGLQSPFDLERGDSQLDQARDQVVSRQVLRAQEILNVLEIDELAVADDLVRHAAGLAHSPRFADRPPSASLVRHCPE